MKKIVVLAFFLSFFACKEQSKGEEEQERKNEVEKLVVTKKFPKELMKVFNAHGGLDKWKNYRTMSFDLPKRGAKEIHTIDLISRLEKITTPNYSMGYDGNGVWLLDINKVYEGDALFYHNLMFYFYAMPFVLADDGINYATTENLEHNGVSYPGIRITYNDGVGVSSKDEYYLHYHPETYQMQWLGYTVTYRSGEASDNVKWIKYGGWQRVADVTIPQELTWYAVEDGEIKEAKSVLLITKTALEMKSKPNLFYVKPEMADYVKSKKE